MPAAEQFLRPKTLESHAPALQSFGKCGFRHGRVNHKIFEYVGPKDETVDRIESFWSML